jgi:hypothetical protein
MPAATAPTTMPRRNAAVLGWIAAFVLLDLYANLVPRWVGYAVPAWLGYVAGFFGLAFLIFRYGLGLRSAKDVGLGRHGAWLRELVLGFALGFGIWALKNVVFAAMGKFELVGWRGLDFALPMLAQALVGMLLASAINDLAVRGFGLAFCRRFRLMAWYVLLTSLVYALDDSWNEGLHVGNLVFSLVLGAALAYTVVRTGAIWMSIGIHWGSNMFFRVMEGFDGRGVVRLAHVVDGARFEIVGIAVTALMLPLLMLLLDRRQYSPAERRQAGGT